MSANARSRKRKPDQTFRYVQKESEDKEEEVIVEKTVEGGSEQKSGQQDGDAKVGGSGKEAKQSTSAAAAGGGGTTSDSEASTTVEPPSKKTNVKSADLLSEEGAERSTANESPPTKTDGFGFLSEADRKLMETDMIEFLKRFAPKYYVPVYKTWTIPKQTAT